MGEVFLALDEELHRKVAIKALPVTLAGDERLRERLHVEARTVAALSHPSVAQIYDLISEGPNHYLVLEYVEGTSLATILGSGQPSLEEALELAVDIAEGLEAAHAQGIVHRDLKAGNVMVTPAGRAKILDFGLAKVLFESAEDHGTPPGGIAGTLSAMSPEQVERRHLDHRSDLFSFGTLLYQMVTGTHPFRQGMPVETMQRIVSHEPTPPHRLNQTVPRGLSQLIMQLLEKAAEDRPDNSSEVAARLRSIRAELEAETSDSARELKKRKRRWAYSIAGTILIITTAIAAWWFLRPPEPTPPLSVAVLPPTLPAEDLHGQATMVAGAVRLSTMNTLAGLDGVFVINTGDLDAIDGSISEIARAVAADEVISATINDAGVTYVLVISRLHGEDGHVLWTDQLEVPFDDVRLVAEAVAGYIARAYPDRRQRPGAMHISAGPEEYEAFLKTRDRVLNPTPDVSWPEVMAELQEIRASSPALLNAYVLEASIARYLYETTRDPEYSSYGEEVIQAALEVAPDDYRSLLAEAESAATWGQLQRAEAALDRIERQEPASVAAMRQRARLEQRRGNADEAVALLATVAQRWPSWRNFLNLAMVERSQGMIESARNNLERALDRAPENVSVKAALAFLEQMNGDLDRAEQLYLEVVAQSPKPHYLSDLGTVAMLLGRYKDALEYFTRAFSMSSTSPVTMLNMADCNSLLGNADEARALYSKIVDLLSQDSQLGARDLEILAQAQAQLGMFYEAIATVDRAILLAPKSGDTMFTATLVHAKAGNIAIARDYHGRAIDAGMGHRWFDLPWFDEMRNADPGSLSTRLNTTVGSSSD